MERNKYGLQLRVPPSQQKKPTTRPPLAPPSAFFRDDDDDVETEIARHASKNKSLRDIEEQHKKALDEDPSVFDYDGVYDEMKEKTARPREHDKQERKPKYIQALIEKAKQREREHEIVYERKLAKERSKEDHLYADKEKFVTSAYKKKLAEQAQWLEEDRIRELREERDDVTKKKDLSDFYFNLTKNVAFGGKSADTKNPLKIETRETEAADTKKSVKNETRETDAESGVEGVSTAEAPSSSAREENVNERETSNRSERNLDPSHSKLMTDGTSHEENVATNQQSADQASQVRHKRNEDALAAAKERYLARKRAKESSEI